MRLDTSMDLLGIVLEVELSVNMKTSRSRPSEPSLENHRVILNRDRGWVIMM